MMDSGDSNRVTKRCVKMTRKQASVMVEFMEAHQEFACGRLESPLRKTVMIKKWNELKEQLDMHGAPKTLEQWRRAWKDLRTKTRAKNSRLLAEREAAGIDLENSGSLSNIELKILGIIGVSTTAPVQKPVLNFKTFVPDNDIRPSGKSASKPTTPEKVKCVSSPVNVDRVSSASISPEIQQSPSQTKVRLANSSQAAAIHQEHGSGKPKVVLTNDRVDDILSKLETFRAESLEVMKVIATGISTIAEGQRDILVIQKERLEFQREILKLERVRVENQSKLEGLLIDVVDCQRRMAAAQEQRAFLNLDET